MPESPIIIKFAYIEKKYTKQTAKKFLIGRFMKTDNVFFLDKVKELMDGIKYIDLEGN